MLPIRNLVHNAHSPEIFADAASGILTFAGNVRLTLEVLRSDYTTTEENGNPIDRVVIGRLVMPLPQAEQMARLILDHAEKLKAQDDPQQPTSTTLN